MTTNHTEHNVPMDVPPPTYWQDFEKITVDVCRLLWKDPDASMNGRQGQPQNGVDVYGDDNRTAKPRLTGVQCKKRKTKSNGYVVPATALTTKDVDAEIAAAKHFFPALEHFVIATTIPRDNDLQKHVLQCSKTKLPFKVSLWFWDDYLHAFEAHPTLMYRYYSRVLVYRKTYSGSQHYLRLLALVIDRPAIRTEFRAENRADDFIKALGHVQNAIKTGVMQDRDNVLVDHAPPPTKKHPELIRAYDLLEEVRSITTKALVDGNICQYEQHLVIRKADLAKRINDLRRQAVIEINNLLIENQIDPLIIKQY